MKDLVITNTLWNLFSFATSALVLLVSVPVMVRAVGLPQYGVLALVMAATGTLSVLNAGVAQATVKYVSGLLAVGKRDLACNVISTSLSLNIAAGFLAITLMYIFSDFIALKVMRVELSILPIVKKAFLLGACIWGIAQVSATFQGALEGCQEYRSIAPVAIIQTLLRVLLAVVAAINFRDILAILTVQLLCDILFVFVWWRSAKFILPEIKFKPSISLDSLKMIRQFVSWQIIDMLFGQVAGVADRFFLSAIRGLAAVGIYSIPQRVLGALESLMAQTYRALLPAIGSLAHCEGQSERQIVEYSWYFSFLLNLLYLSLFLVSYPVMVLWLGPETGVQGAPLLQVFCITLMFELPSVGMSRYLLGHGLVKWGTISDIATTMVTLTMIYYLGTRFGVYGIAWSGMGALITTRITFHFWILKKRFVNLGVWKSFFSLYSHILFAICPVLGVMLISPNALNAPRISIPYAIFVMVVYIGVTYFAYPERFRKLLKVLDNLKLKALQRA